VERKPIVEYSRQVFKPSLVAQVAQRAHPNGRIHAAERLEC
jgi:hypothetical protein